MRFFIFLFLSFSALAQGANYRLSEPDYHFVNDNIIDEGYHPPLKLNLENQNRVLQPYENFEEEDFIARKLVLEFDFAAGDDFDIYVRGNVADIEYFEGQRRLNVDLPSGFDNVGAGFKYEF